MKRLQVNPEKCLGCRTCENVCSFKHFGAYNPHQGNVNVLSCEKAGIQVPLACRQCKDPVCMAACKFGAISKNTDGVVLIDQEKCKGCQMCVKACPTHNCVFNVSLKKAHKCDLCGGDPECVKYCPTGALVYVEEDLGAERKAKLAKVLADAFASEIEEKKKLVKTTFEKEGI